MLCCDEAEAVGLRPRQGNKVRAGAGWGVHLTARRCRAAWAWGAASRRLPRRRGGRRRRQTWRLPCPGRAARRAASVASSGSSLTPTRAASSPAQSTLSQRSADILLKLLPRMARVQEANTGSHTSDADASVVCSGSAHRECRSSMTAWGLPLGVVAPMPCSCNQAAKEESELTDGA